MSTRIPQLGSSLRALALAGLLATAACRAEAEAAPRADAEAEAEARAVPRDTAPSGAPPAFPSAPAAAAAPSGSSSAPATPAPTPARLAFVGDLAMTMLVQHWIDARADGRAVPPAVDAAFPFSHVAARLAASDLVVGNLECVLSPLGARATTHNPFRCSLRTPEVLLGAHIGLVSVANNHALDFGANALADTLRRLERGGLPSIGRAAMEGRPTEPFVRTIAGVRVAILGYAVPPRQALADVAAAAGRADFVVVFAHWGAENRPEPTPEQRGGARALVDAGADLVVGTHAHVLQPCEWYEGKLLAYGLGNFVFNAMQDTEARRGGAMLEAELLPPDEARGRARVAAYRLQRTRLDDHGAPVLVGEPEPLGPPAEP
ncbi:MAG: CapA family protein [Polyangiaceae bacterium]|nr:CapA family protein [Polyangiaceae bacterium]